MERAKQVLARLLRVVEIEFDAAALAVCWWVSWRLLEVGRSSLEVGGSLPRGLEAAVAVALGADALSRVGSWAWGGACLVIAAVLAWSAAEGTWSLLRRIARPA